MSGRFLRPSTDKRQLEEGTQFTPRFGADGLITTVVTDSRDGALLMVAHMNEDALEKTLETGTATYWSRSRGSLWVKGETSGNTQTVEEIRIDCDQDVIWLKVRVAGDDATCHTGRRSCFYRVVRDHNGGFVLEDDGSQPRFDPAETYR